MIYNVVLISAVQYIIQAHIHIHFLYSFPSMIYHRVLNVVLCAIQQDLIAYPLIFMILATLKCFIQLKSYSICINVMGLFHSAVSSGFIHVVVCVNFLPL